MLFRSKKKIKDYFLFIAEQKIMIELNTKGFGRYGLFFPNKENIKYIKEFSIPVVVNSDAHYPSDVNAGRKEALNLLKDNRIDNVMELHAGKWVETPILI